MSAKNANAKCKRVPPRTKDRTATIKWIRAISLLAAVGFVGCVSTPTQAPRTAILGLWIEQSARKPQVINVTEVDTNGNPIGSIQGEGHLGQNFFYRFAGKSDEWSWGIFHGQDLTIETPRGQYNLILAGCFLNGPFHATFPGQETLTRSFRKQNCLD